MKLWTSQDRNTLRLALAVTLAVLLAFVIAWPAAFIFPVFVSVILCAGGPVMSAKQGFSFLAAVIILLWLGQALAEFFIPFPIVCSLLIIWLLFVGQYASLSGVSTLLVVILFLAILMLPLLGMMSAALVNDFVSGLYISIVMAVFCCWLAYGVVTVSGPVAAPAAADSVLDKNERVRIAAIKTLLVMPLFIVFYLLELTGSLLVLVFVALLIQMPSAQTGAKSVAAMVAANAFGGLAAVIIYNLLTVAPSLLMLGLLMFATTLMFGKKVYSGEKTSALYGTGLNTVIILLGSATGTFGDDAGGNMWVRLFQITAAGVYIVAALSLAERVLTPKGAVQQDNEAVPV